ncbi:MAG: hypothetical protein IKM75_08570, partial [Bacteroidales bacterium]|nr:hypothetical protein [Bacteroidales bacterium]
DNGLRDALVGEKMLAEGLLGAYFHIKSVIPAKILIIFCYFCKLNLSYILCTVHTLAENSASATRERR